MPAFKKLQLIIGLRWPEVEWMDLEFLWGRHSIGKGAIVVLDYVSEEFWALRQKRLAELFLEIEWPTTIEEVLNNGVYWAQSMSPEQALPCWEEMQESNQKTGVTFYEGLVAYDIEQPYPVQLFSPKKETRHWVKYRFIQ